MRRDQFVLGTASAAALPFVGLGGCSPGSSLSGLAPGLGPQFAKVGAGKYFVETAASSCPLGPILKASLDSIKGYPNKTVLELLGKVAAAKNVSASQVIVANALLGNYAGIGNVPKPGVPLKFPADNGEHFDTTIEWRYITLSMPLKGGGIISLLMNFFRKALIPPNIMPSLSPVERQLYSTSIGVTVELPGRPGVHYLWPITAMSGCDVTVGNEPFTMVLGKNFLKGSNNVFPLHLHLEDPGDWSVGRPSTVVDVEIAGTNPLFLQGLNGYVGPADEDPGFAWYYYSWPQQKVTGTVTFDRVKYNVENALAWMDHQWGGGKPQTSGPISDGTGWCWFEFQFNNNQSLTCAIPHQKLPPSGKLPQFNSGFGTYVDNKKSFLVGALLQVQAYTQSPFTTASYPSAWNLQILPSSSANPIALVVTPKCSVEPQTEWMMGITEYSEANCTVTAQGSLGTKSINLSGVGYCEGVGFEKPAETMARQVAYLKSTLG